MGVHQLSSRVMVVRIRVLVIMVLAVVVSALAAPMSKTGAAEATRPPRGFIDAAPTCRTEAPPSDAPEPAVDDEPGSIKVGTFNVLFAEGSSNASLDARLPLIVDAVHGSGADVVGIQEDELIGSRGHTSERIARALAASTGDSWSWCFFMANPILPDTPDTYVGGGNPQSDPLMAAGNSLGESVWRTGIGLVSRYPVVDAGAHRLPRRVNDEVAACGGDFLCAATVQFESRAALRALLDTPGGRINVVSTHLVHRMTDLSGVSRLVQSEALVRWIDDFSSGSGVPVVLTGDFNSSPGTDVHTSVVDAGFLDTFGVAEPAEPGFTSSQGITATESTVRSRIDYVFARAGACASPLGSGTGVLTSAVIGDAPSVTGTEFLWPSDHYGVVSEVLPFPDDPDSCPVTHTARFGAQTCATLARVADATGGSVADVLRVGVGIFRQLAESDLVPPSPRLPANDGPCRVVVSWPAAERAAIADTAAAWGVDADRLTAGGGWLVLAIIYALARQGPA